MIPKVTHNCEFPHYLAPFFPRYLAYRMVGTTFQSVSAVIGRAIGCNTTHMTHASSMVFDQNPVEQIKCTLVAISQSFWGTGNLSNSSHLPGKNPRRSGGVPVAGRGIGHVPWHDRSLRTDAGIRLPAAD